MYTIQFSCKQSKQYKMDAKNICEIPTEVINQVFIHLDYNSLLKMQTTCKRFYNLTRTFGKFAVKFTNNMDSITIESLSKCNIYKLVLHDIRRLPDLTFPQNINQLVLNNGCNANVLKTALITFNQSTSLSFIEANSQSDAFQDEEFQNIMLKFENLKYISFINCTQGMKHSEDWVMKLSKSKIKFPKLISFEACGFDMDILGFYNFLSRHSSTLETLNLTCTRCKNDISCNPNLLFPLNFIKLKNIKTSCILGNCSYYINYSGQCVPKHILFQALRKKHLPLESFILESETISIPDLYEELKFSKSTLKCLVIGSIIKANYNNNNPNRLEWLKEFDKLETLSLNYGFFPNVLLYETTFWPIIYDQFRLCNTIKSLTLIGLDITKSNLLETLSTLTGLKELKLFGMGIPLDAVSGLDSTFFIETLQTCQQMEKFTFGRASYQSCKTRRQERYHWRIIFRLAKKHCINIIPEIYWDNFNEPWDKMIFGANLFTFNLPINQINVETFKSRCFILKDKWNKL